MPLNGLPGSAIPAPRLRQVLTKKGTPIRKTLANRATTLPRQAQVPSSSMRQARVSTLAPMKVWIPASTGKGVEPRRHPRTMTKLNKQFRKGTLGVKKAPKA